MGKPDVYVLRVPEGYTPHDRPFPVPFRFHRDPSNGEHWMPARFDRIPAPSIAGPGEVVVAVETLRDLAGDHVCFKGARCPRCAAMEAVDPLIAPPAPAVELCAWCELPAMLTNPEPCVYRVECCRCATSGPIRATSQGAFDVWDAMSRAIRAARAANTTNGGTR